MKQTIVTVSALCIVASAGCYARPNPTETGKGLQARLRSTTIVRIEYAELDGESSTVYEIDDAAQIGSLVDRLAALGGWQEKEEGAWSAREIAFVEFGDAEGASLWNCTLLTNGIEFRDSGGRTWLTRCEGILNLFKSVAKQKEH